MRKDHEINLLENMIAQTPRGSYLRSMLEHLKPQFECDIRSDFFTLPNLREIEREIYEQKKIILDLRKTQETVRKEILDQRRDQASIYQRLTSIKKDVSLAGAMLETAVNNFSKP